MFYVHLLNSSTKKARSKYETNKEKTSYDFSVSLYIKYLVPRFYTDLSNMYLGIEIRLSIRYRTTLSRNIIFIKTMIDLILLIEIIEDTLYQGLSLWFCLQCSRYRVFIKNVIYVAYDITYTDFAMRSVIERNHDQTHNWLWHV